MWGYQPHFRISLQHRIREVLRKLGAGEDVEAEVLLVGVRTQQSANRNLICIEPEDGKWPLFIFGQLLQAVESAYRNHPSLEIFYSDEQSMREKPEMIRRDAVSKAVGNALEEFDKKNEVESFCGEARIVGDYYVVPVIQIPESLFKKFPPLAARPPTHWGGGNGYRSLIHAAISKALEDASDELAQTDPGKSMRSKREADELVRIASKNFMHTPGIATSTRYTYADLFERFNLISSLLYEGAKGIGNIILADPNNTAIEYVIRFQQPVPFGEPRWARKILQMASADISLIADSEKICGLGRVSSSYDLSLQNIFRIDFLDHYHWELSCGAQVLLRSQYGVPQLPFEIIEKELFVDNYVRMFPQTSAANQEQIWNLFNVMTRQNHGSMIVVAEDAESEAERLAQQGTKIEPVELTEELLCRVSGIDGSILLDPSGKCHAIGVILDGAATDDCTPARGSRFNSAVRYAQSSGTKRFAIVASDDRTVDVFPMLRPNLSRALIESKIAELERATTDNYYRYSDWLSSHRFYLDEMQCSRINDALSRIDALPREDGEIRFTTTPFWMNTEWSSSYLTE